MNGERQSSIDVIQLADSEREGVALSRGIWVVAGTSIVLAILDVIYNPRGWMSLVIVAAVALAPLWKLLSMAKRDLNWLAFALMLFSLLDGAFFLSDKTRPIITYGLTLLFCLPVVPALWSAWKIRNSAFRLYLLFCIWCLISVSYSIAPEFSISRLARNLLLLAAITACSAAARKTGDVRSLIRAMTLAAVAVTAINTAALILPHSITWHSGVDIAGEALSDLDEGVPRFAGLLGNPNEVGELAGLTIGLILFYLEFAQAKEKAFLIPIAIVAAALGVIADSRSDFIGLAIGSTLYLCWRYRLRGIGVIAVLGGVAAASLRVLGNGASSYIWRGDVSSLTGRTDIWQFAIRQIAEKPLTGYGWAVGGAIFNNRYFPVWWGPWDQGPHSSLHSGYLTCVVGVGIPATILWLFIVLWPWFSLFRQSEDPWHLKRAFFFLVIPMLMINLDESMITDCAGAAGFLFMMTWALAEQQRLSIIRDRHLAKRRVLRNLPGAAAALVS